MPRKHRLLSVVIGFAVFTSGVINCERLFNFTSDKSKQTDTPTFQFTVDDRGDYSLTQGTTTWLQGAPTFVYTDGHRFSTEDGSLKFSAKVEDAGTDKIGVWRSICFLYLGGIRLFRCCFKIWINPNLPIIIFQQGFLSGTVSSAQNPDSVISSFPSFQIPRVDEGIAYLSYQGSMFGGGTTGTARWYVDDFVISGGIVGGPLALYDQNNSVAILAPFSEFMAASRCTDQYSRLNWGVMGGVNSVPVGFEYQTILYLGYSGINEAFATWGQFMRSYYGKDDFYRKTDLTLNYLGYWTDGGAYYYYHTEPDKSYEQTILDVYSYANSQNIPYKYVQYDSWFYPKGPDGGVLMWSPTHFVAPDGFEYIFNKTEWPTGAHNRYWSPKTPYAKANGGPFNFIVETKKAIPQDLSFWMYLFKQAKIWGLVLYEQDWLDNEFAGLNATLSTVNVAKTWLLQMGQAARATDLTIQYCMSNPRHGMQSLEIPVVTQARVSGDYRAGSDQWQIGEASIFADAMGIAPFKDTFWTIDVQPGNTYNLSEPNGELQTAVATLSTGPVGPGDMIQHTNISMLMQCCRKDGLILKPSRPARAIDKQFWQRVWGGGIGPSGQVWTTYSQIGEFYFGIILATAMEANFNLSPTDAGFSFFNPTVVFKRSPKPGIPSVLMSFSNASPVTLATACSRKDFCLYYTSPVLAMGDSQVVIYGEQGKFVPISSGRVDDINTFSDDIQLTVKGASNEIIFFAFFLDGKYTQIVCEIGPSGKSLMSFKNLSCLFL